MQHQSLTCATAAQVKGLENKCKEIRDELKAAREEIDRLQAQMLDMVPRADFNNARKVFHQNCHMNSALSPGLEEIIFITHCKLCTIIDDIPLVSYSKPEKGKCSMPGLSSRVHTGGGRGRNAARPRRCS
jgi:hypothetical protein